MSLIKSINHVELPNWFTKDRYLKIKRSPINVIDDELATRRYLDHESREGNFDDNEYEELFDERAPFVREQSIENHEFTDENVKALNTLNVIQMYSNLQRNGVDLSVSRESYNNSESLNNLCKPVHLTSAMQATNNIDGVGLFMGISLSHATDGEILEEVSRLLKKTRKELYENKSLNRKSPSRFNLQEMYDNLFYWPVFEYIDLNIWARTKGIRLSRTYYREAFDLLRYKKFEPHQISGSIKRNAEHAISFEFAEQLKHLMKNRKKVHNFNPS
jgi:hypothetical protein